MTMLPIKINLHDLVQEFCLSEEEEFQLNRKIMSTIAVEFMEKWEKLADTELNHTLPEYKKAMYFRQPKASEVVFGLDDRSKLANDVESGRSSYDMKPLYANSPNKKTTLTGGWYVDVPFRHSTKKAYANSNLFASVMPRGIYDAARNKDKPLTRSDLVRKYSNPLTNKQGYTHSNPIYDGLVKLPIVDNKGKETSGYFTFRRVSDKSEPMSWINPGNKAYDLMGKTENLVNIDKITDDVITEFFKKL